MSGLLLAPVNKIIDSSVVDGPGNRTSIFLQGCNIACAYCHNPETQKVCQGCGKCVQSCPEKALSIIDNKVIWDKEKCCGCDTCISVCPHNASPKITLMTPDEVLERIKGNMPFIRGITTSGGECMLHPQWLTELYKGAKELGLTTLADSNGTIDFSEYPDLMKVCSGVMLDVKSWSSDVFQALTGHGNSTVLKNLEFLSKEGKLEEVRIVCVDENSPVKVDAEEVIRGIARITAERKNDFLLKIIRFRKNGVRGILSDAPSPDTTYMDRLLETAKEEGFERVRLV